MSAAAVAGVGIGSAVASVLGSVVEIVRTVIAYALEYVKRFIEWSGQHPLATILLVVNMAIWIS